MNNDTINTMDANILLSFINTKLRDQYSSLDALSDDLDLNIDIIVNRLKEIDYYYDKEQNKFK